MTVSAGQPEPKKVGVPNLNAGSVKPAAGGTSITVVEALPEVDSECFASTEAAKMDNAANAAIGCIEVELKS